MPHSPPRHVAALLSVLAGCANGDAADVGSGPAPERWRRTRQSIRERFPHVDHITTEEVQRRLGSDAPPLLLDVRSPAEFAVSHLRGARNVTDPQAVPADRPVVVYCSVGYRSAAFAERLRAAGRRNVSNYLGSIFEWANAGLPVYRGSEKVTRVHPYDADWGELLRPDLRR